MSSLLLRGARVPGHEQPVDLLIGESGRIERIASALPVASGMQVRELKNRLVVPGLIDAHQHLDKTRTLRAVQNPRGTLEGASVRNCGSHYAPVPIPFRRASSARQARSMNAGNC